MKVKRILPGQVFNRGDKWYFTTTWDGFSRESKESFSSASAAKQMMREYVAFQRKVNGVRNE